MDDQIGVCVGDRCENFEEERDACRQVEPLDITMPIDALALHYSSTDEATEYISRPSPSQDL